MFNSRSYIRIMIPSLLVVEVGVLSPLENAMGAVIQPITGLTLTYIAQPQPAPGTYLYDYNVTLAVGGEVENGDTINFGCNANVFNCQPGLIAPTGVIQLNYQPNSMLGISLPTVGVFAGEITPPLTYDTFMYFNETAASFTNNTNAPILLGTLEIESTMSPSIVSYFTCNQSCDALTVSGTINTTYITGPANVPEPSTNLSVCAGIGIGALMRIKKKGHQPLKGSERNE